MSPANTRAAGGKAVGEHIPTSPRSLERRVARWCRPRPRCRVICCGPLLACGDRTTWSALPVRYGACWLEKPRAAGLFRQLHPGRPGPGRMAGPGTRGGRLQHPATSLGHACRDRLRPDHGQRISAHPPRCAGAVLRRLRIESRARRWLSSVMATPGERLPLNAVASYLVRMVVGASSRRLAG